MLFVLMVDVLNVLEHVVEIVIQGILVFVCDVLMDFSLKITNVLDVLLDVRLV